MIHHGDCLEVLKTLEPDSIDALVTDPPAGISFMGKDWDSESKFVIQMHAIFDRCYRVLKPGAHGFVWALPRTSHWTASELENAGFEIRDVVTHLFGSGFPKSLNLGNGWGTGLKPASEHWILVRKPLAEKTVAANVLKHGTGGINIDISRITANTESWELEKNLCDTCANLVENNVRPSTQGIKDNFVHENADTKDSEKTLGNQQDVISSVDIGCSEEISKGITNINSNMFILGKSTTDLSQKDLSFTTLTKSKLITELRICISCKSEITSNSISSNTNLTTSEKLSTLDANVKVGRFPSNLILDEVAAQMLDEQSGELKGPWGKNGDGSKNGETSIFKIGGINSQNELRGQEIGGASRFFYCAKTSKSERNAGLDKPSCHPTVKPKKLMSYLINMITPPSGLVLDPFMGSGSTGVACAENGFEFIGIEKELEYFQIAEKRIAHAVENSTPAQANLI